MLVQRAAAHVQELQVGAARVRRAAQHDHAAVRPRHVGLDRIEAHVRIDGHRIGAVAVERFARVLVRGGADVAALGVEHQRDVWIRLAQIGADVLELVFGAQRGKIGDLRLEGAGQVGGGIDDRLAELHDRIRLAGQVRREARQVRVEAHTQQRIVAGPCSRQFLNESHFEPLVSE